MTSPASPGDTPPAPPRQRSRPWAIRAVTLVVAAAAVVTMLQVRSRAPGRMEPAPATPVAEARIPDEGVVAYYFHTTHRCTSCRKIEAYSRLAIESGFAGDIAGGRLQFRLVNLDEPGNAHFVQDYKLYTKALVLSGRTAGHEVRWKNLTRVWELLNDEPAFVDYVQRETRTFLAETP